MHEISRFRGQVQKTAKLKCREKCILELNREIKMHEKILFFSQETKLE